MKMYKILTLLLLVFVTASTCNEDDVNITGMISDLDCAGAVHNGTLTGGNAAVGVNSIVSYTGGNGGPHGGQTVSSTGVTGLVAVLNAGNFENGVGNLTYSIIGAPSGIGVANFPLNIGGQICTLSRVVSPLVGSISNLNCAGAVNTGTLTAGTAANGVSSSITYTGGNGGVYSGQSVSSTGVSGLTATLTNGTFNGGSGSITYTITGTPASPGMANFALNIGGQNCVLQRTVLPNSSCGAFVASGVWKEFMCHNLGANTNADPYVPSWELIGNYYQWGRNPTCFGRDGIDATNPCISPIYGAAGPWGSTAANDNAGNITGWSTINAPDNAWSDVTKTNNDPCPSGFRVPTKTQWDGVTNSDLNARTYVGTWTNNAVNYSSGVRFGSSLFLPTSGYRNLNSGAEDGRGGFGFYWSSTTFGSTEARNLYFLNNNAYVGNYSRTNGISIRCIAQ